MNTSMYMLTHIQTFPQLFCQPPLMFTYKLSNAGLFANIFGKNHIYLFFYIYLCTLFTETTNARRRYQDPLEMELNEVVS